MTSKRILIGTVAAVLVAAAVALALVAGTSGAGSSTGWGDPIELPDVRATTSTAAVTPDGGAVVAWAEETERGFAIRTAERAPGGDGDGDARGLHRGNGRLDGRADGRVMIEVLYRAIKVKHDQIKRPRGRGLW